MSWQAPPPAGFGPGQQGPYYGGPPPQGYPNPGYPPPSAPGYPPPGQPEYPSPPIGPPGYPPPGQPSYPPPSYQPPASGYAYPKPEDNMYPGQSYGGTYSQDLEGQDLPGMDFSDKSIRRGFIRKVYSILSLQLLVTFAIVSLFTFHEGTRRFAMQNRYIVYIIMACVFIMMIAMACCDSLRRKSPTNYIFLSIFTGLFSVMVGYSAAVSDPDAILMAMGLTIAVTVGLTLFAFQTKWDFTMMSGALFVMLIILFVFGIITIFIRNNIVHMVYGALGVLLFSLFLVYDTQMMMGGNHKYSISPEEYIFASLNLYLDIINIFMYLLTIISASRD